MKSSRALAIAAVVGVSAVGLTVPVVDASPAAAATTVTITPNPAYAAAEPFEGWGTSLVWFANATGGYPEDVRQDLLDKVFGEDGLNLNIARYNIGGGNATDVPPYLRPGGAVEGWWNPDLDASDDSGQITATYADRDRYAAAWDADDPAAYNWDADETQRWWIEALKDKITTWEAFSNSPPYFLTESGFVSGGINDANAEQLAPEDMDAFAGYLVNVVEHLEQTYGIDFSSLDPFNEPNTNYWGTTIPQGQTWPTSASRQEGAHIGPARQNQMIQALAERLAMPSTTTDVPISAMDETNPSRFVTNWNGWSQESKDLVSQLNVHTYGTSDRVMVRDIAKASDKPLWMSEVEGDWDTSGRGFNQTNIDNGLGMATRMIDDLRELEPTAWVFWQPVEDLYNMEKVEKLNWGSVFIDFDCNADGDSVRRIQDGDADPSCQVLTNAKYNTVRNFTHYIRPGDTLVPTNDTQTTAALNQSGDGVTLVHANTEASARTVTLDLSEFGQIAPGATVTPITTTESPAGDVTQNALVEGAAVPVDRLTRSATLTVPAKSVTTFVVSGVSGVSADAPQVVDGQTYQLVGVQSGKALAADGATARIRTAATTTDAASAQAWTATSLTGEGTNRQQVLLRNGAGGYLAASGTNLTVTAADPEAAAADPNFQWIPTTTDGRTFSFLNVATTRVLDVNGASTADGASVGLWTSNNGSNQAWTLASTAVQSVSVPRVSTPVDVPAVLPETVTVRYSGGVERSAAVTWNTAGIDWSTPGSAQIAGAGTDLFGAAFEATATVDIGEFTLTRPASVTTFAGSSLTAVQAAAPTTVEAEVRAGGAATDIPVTWDWAGLNDTDFAETGTVEVSGQASVSDEAAAIPATLTVILTERDDRNVAPDSTASATFTESNSYSVTRTINGVTTDKGWSNWRSGTKNTQDTLTYVLANEETVSSVKTYFYRDGGTTWPATMHVEYRVGTGAWTSTDPVTVPAPASGAPTVEIPLEDVTADQVRVVLDARAATHMIVSEVEIYAKSTAPSSIADLARVVLGDQIFADLTPERTEYTASWSGSTGPIVSAVPVDRDATVAIAQTTGEPDVATILVTAPDGTTKTYRISIERTVAVGAVTISGDARDGKTVTVEVTGVDPDAELSYQWERDGVAIDGATSAQYVVQPEDIGLPLRVTVTAAADGFVSAVVSSAAVVPLSGPGLDEGLVVHYPLDETSGTVVSDTSGNDRDATVEGSANWLAGDGFVFGGGGANSGNAIKLPDNVIAGLDSISITFDAWVDPALTGNHFIFNLGNLAVGSPQSGNGYLFITSTQYQAKISDLAWAREQATSAGRNLEKGSWKHLTYTQTGTTGILYENGVEVARNTGLTITPADIGDGTTTRNYLGRSAYAADNSFRGVIRDFRIYDRALLPEDVATLSNQTLTELVEADAAGLPEQLGSLDDVISDITLPTSGERRTAITWQSANPDVVSASGVVTRPSSDTNVRLTATVSIGEITRTVPVTVHVRGTTSPDQAAVESAAALLTVPGLDDVRGNITLPSAAGSGITVTWSSSDAGTINGDGVVNRPATGSEQKTVTLTATFTKGEASAAREFTATVKPLPADAAYEGYLFAYFTGDSIEGEKIYLGLSDGNDASSWMPLNGGQPVITSDKGTGGLRDPFIVRSPEGDRFYMIATDLSIGGGTSWDASQRSGSTYLEVWESTDLIHWSDQRHVKVSPDTAGNTWAPEAFWDDSIGAYVVFWASKIYDEADTAHTGSTYNKMMYATTRDFRTFTPAQVWQDTGVSRIDSTVIKEGDVYHRFTKDEAQVGGCLDVFEETSTDLRAVTTTDPGAWTMQKECIGRSAGTGAVEGPTIVKANPGDPAGEGYYLFLDEFGGRKYIPLFSEKLGADADWHVIPATLPTPAPRHGTVLPVTKAEYERLFAQYVPAITDVADVAVTTTVGSAPSLPEKVRVTFSDASTRSLSVTWDDLDAANWQQTGSVTVTGALAGTGLPVEASVRVVPVGAEILAHYDFTDLPAAPDAGTVVEDRSDAGNDAVIRGTGATASDGVLTLPGGSSSSGAAYVELPTGIVDGQDTLTVSAWLQSGSSRADLSALFFGAAGNPPGQYWLLNPNNRDGLIKSVITDGQNPSAPWGLEAGISPTTASKGVPGPAATSELALYTSVIRPGSITFYLNDQKIGTVATTRTVSQFGSDLVAYIGRSSYPDPLWKGSVQALTISTVAAGDAAVSAAFAAGPDGSTTEPTPTPTPTTTPTATPTPTPTGEPTATPTPEPTGEPTGEPTATPTPTISATPPSEGDLTPALEDLVTGAATVTAGQTIVVDVGTGRAGQSVDAWIFSVPRHLGTSVVTAAGTITVTIPSDLPAGQHRLAVTDASGSVIGWYSLTVTAAPGGLSTTGGVAPLGWALAGAILLLGGWVAVTGARRARRGM